jgi:hypothetical protein
MMKWFRQQRYSHVFLKGEFVQEGGKKRHVEGLKSYIWRYIKSVNIPDLDVNRAALVNLLKEEHKTYILHH